MSILGKGNDQVTGMHLTHNSFLHVRKVAENVEFQPPLVLLYCDLTNSVSDLS